MSMLQNLSQIVTAIGGLGTAAFGLVDSTKLFFGGANRIGFDRIVERSRSHAGGAGHGVEARQDPAYPKGQLV